MVNNNLMIFEGHDVEVFELNGQVLFNPKHVAEILEIKNVNDNLRKMNDNQSEIIVKNVIKNWEVTMNFASALFSLKRGHKIKRKHGV